MKQVETPWGYVWSGPAKYLTLSRGEGHPEIISGRPAWAVRRWKSNVAGEVRVVGSFRHGKQGDGTGGRILLDGREVFAAIVGGKEHPEEVKFDLALTVREGSLIDFAITPGPALDISYDATSLAARIIAVAVPVK